MAYHLHLKQPDRGHSHPYRAHSYQAMSDRKKQPQIESNNNPKKSYFKYKKSKPMTINKPKTSKPPQATSQPLQQNNKSNAFKTPPQQQTSKISNNCKPNKRRHGQNLSRDKAQTYALLQLQHNWNNRKPYAHKRKQLKSSSQNLHKTEFKLLLNEHQMTQCYDPVKLYQLNKELMVKNIGTCRVEALTLMISVPKGRKDLTEGIQIVEKIIGPVEYLNEEKNKKGLYSIARNKKGTKMFNTVDLKLNADILKQIESESVSDEDAVKLNKSINSLNSRKRARGASLLSECNTAKMEKKSNTPKIKLSVQSELQKRQKTRRFSDDYVNVLKKNQSKSAVQSMSFDDDLTLNGSNDEHKQTDMKLNESLRSTVNIEQEWDDFDEIMTDDSLGIRLHAQLLMERKLMLRQQQKNIRETIRKQKGEEEKLQERIVRRKQNSQSNTNPSIASTQKTIIVHEKAATSLIEVMSLPDIPDENTVSTIDELYGSFPSNQNNNKPADTSDDDVYSTGKHKDFYKIQSNHTQRSLTCGSDILNELKSLTEEIDQELQIIDDKILDTQSIHYNNKIKSVASLTSYNNKMIRMMRNAAYSNRKSSSLTNILPFHRSHVQNQALLRIIHSIENMSQPMCNEEMESDGNETLISLIIRQFAHTFGALLSDTETKHKHIGIINEEKCEYKQGNKRRDSIDLDIYQSADTVPLPNDMDILKISPPNNTNTQIHGPLLAKKKSIKFRLTENINMNNIEQEYEYCDYESSALIIDEYRDDWITDNDVMHSLLSQNDLLSEIIFFNIASIIKHFSFLLRMLSALSFGMQHQRERILATMLKKIANIPNTDYLQQKLLFSYWSSCNYMGTNYDDSDFYLYKDYGSVVLYGLSTIIYHKRQKNDAEDQGSNFIAEAAKCWKDVVSNVGFREHEHELVLNYYNKLICNNIPSYLLFPAVNRCNMRYNKLLSEFVIDAFIYKNIYDYKNCNVYDIFGYGCHSHKDIKLKSPFLLRIGVNCKNAEMMQYIYDLFNSIWSNYKYILANGKLSINNKILFLNCQCITNNVCIWCLKGNLIHINSVRSLTSFLQNIADIHSFIHHFIVSSVTIFISSYIMALDWNEIIQICFIDNKYGDLYVLSPLSVLFKSNKNKQSLNIILNNINETSNDNIFLSHVHKLLCSLQKSYNHIQQFECSKKKKKKKNNNLWNIWILHVKRLFNIIIFNINESDLNSFKDKKHYFDHSNLFQIIQITKMLYWKQSKTHDVTQHFANMLHVEISH